MKAKKVMEIELSYLHPEYQKYFYTSMQLPAQDVVLQII